MKVEVLFVIIGVLICLIGGAIVFDALRPPDQSPTRERRRRIRTEMNQIGQVLVGAGAICLGAAMIGRDTWRLGTIVVFAGSALLLAGAVMNRVYLKELLLFRGASRRSGKDDEKPKEPPQSTGGSGTMRIR